MFRNGRNLLKFWVHFSDGRGEVAYIKPLRDSKTVRLPDGFIDGIETVSLHDGGGHLRSLDDLRKNGWVGSDVGVSSWRELRNRTTEVG